MKMKNSVISKNNDFPVYNIPVKLLVFFIKSGTVFSYKLRYIVGFGIGLITCTRIWAQVMFIHLKVGINVSLGE